MSDLLVAVRGLHFASTAMVAGALIFEWTIFEPSFRVVGRQADEGLLALRLKLRTVVWIGLALVVVSGALWLLALAARIGAPAQVVLSKTNFGHVWIGRAVLATLLQVLALRMVHRVSWRRAPAAIAGICLMGSLAWSGHAAGTPGVAGDVHRASDVLHLVACAAWLGGLLPLWLLLSSAQRSSDRSVTLATVRSTHRFSILGILAVATLLGTGLVNAWALVGSPGAVVHTDFGRLLAFKVVLFLLMVAVAAFNRIWLTPRLPGAGAASSLARNALLELALGLAILAIVGVLGALPPASHAGMSMH